MKHKRTAALLGAFFALSTFLAGQWSEHLTPVGFPTSSMAMLGDSLMVKWHPSESVVLGGVALKDDNGTWQDFTVPEDTLCPNNICKPKYIAAENGHLYYYNPTWPGFIFSSSDGGGQWQETLPYFNDYPKAFFAGDRIFTLGNALWMFDHNTQEWTLSFQSLSGWGVRAMCKWGAKLLLLEGNGVYASDDNGDSWTLLTTAVNCAGVPYEDVEIFAFGDAIFVGIKDLGLYTSLNAGADWELLPFPGDGPVSTMIAQNGKLFCGDGRHLYFSENQGFSWVKHPTAPGATVLLAKNDTLYMATAIGVFLSADGGKNWWAQHRHLERLFSGTSLSVENKTLFSFADRLYLANEFGIFETADDGQNWRCASHLKNIRQGIAVGDALIIREDQPSAFLWHITRDTGQTWQEMTLPAAGLDQRKLLAYGNGRLFAFVDLKCYASDDLGESWSVLPVQFVNTIRQAVFASGQLFAATYPGGVSAYYYSADGGSSWTEQLLSVGAELRLFTNGSGLYASYGANYYRRENGLWNPISLEPGHQIIEADQNVLAYRVDNLYNHSLLGSGDQGENWMDLLGPQPFLTNADYDRGAHAFGIHNHAFYAFGRSAGNAFLPVMWKLDLGELENAVRFGAVFFDENNNGVQDGTEPGIPDAVVFTVAQPTQAITNAAGKFALFYSTAGDTLRTFISHPNWTSTPPFYALNTTSQNYPFGIAIPPGTVDFALTATAAAPFRPGFSTPLVLEAINMGAVSTTAEIRLVLPANIGMTNVSPAPNAIIGDTVIWEIALTPFQDFRIDLDLSISTDAVLGAVLDFHATITPGLPDDILEDNDASFTATVVGSYDPNDKQVSPVELTTTAVTAGAWLDYTVRFQNTGTAAANLVRIIDTLPVGLNPVTLQIQGASHPCVYTFRPGGVLEVIFSDIFLTDTLTSVAMSQGFVRFALYLPPGSMPSDTIRNTAQIFFDFNPPIRTNEAKTWLNQDVGTPAYPAREYQGLQLTPNPTRGIFSILSPVNNQGTVFVLDLTGKILLQESTLRELDLSEYPSGIYVVVLRTTSGENYIGKLVLD